MFKEEYINEQPPMMQAYMRLKNQYLDKFLFYQMGDFFEMFFDDAVNASSILNITLTKRGKGDDSIPMAGVPLSSVDNYVQKILASGKSVVIAEQVGEPTGKGIMERKVSRIVTPGTVLDATLLDPKENKYLCSIYEKDKTVEISWINFSSGEIWCSKTTVEKTLETLQKINPAEILISYKQVGKLTIPQNIPVSFINEDEYDLEEARSFMIKSWGAQYLFNFGLPDENCIIPIITLINYLKSTQATNIEHIQSIKWFNSDDFLLVDNNSKRHLEIIEGSGRYNLWNTLDKCSTGMGSRNLKEWLNNPIKNLEVIESRLDKIEFLLSNTGYPYSSWKEIVSNWCDIERITTKISLRTARPRDLSSLRDTLRVTDKIWDWSNAMPLALQEQFKATMPPQYALDLLNHYLTEEPSLLVRDGGVIADGFNEELDEYRKLQEDHGVFLKEFEEREKLAHNINNLKVDFNGAQGFFISISNSHLDKVPAHYIRKQTLKNAERYTTSELKEYEDKALSAKEKSINLERHIYSNLMDQLQEFVGGLQRYAKLIAEWDTLASLAEIAHTENFCRPTFNSKSGIVMIEGRHPIISLKQDNFIPNSLELKRKENVAIITGPNMGGKSTLMRQLALLVVMAHIGSFVPAKKFSVPDIDAIFTRIGANDDISNGRSTFMVEMGESAYILKNATFKSLVLLDELGRGTATYDGLSLAWSIAKYLAQRIKSYTLFATHYLEMTDLEKELNNVKNYHVAAIEQGDKIKFTYQIEEGCASRSYGLNVAELAGINKEILSNAKIKLQELETVENLITEEDTVENNSAVCNNSMSELDKEILSLNLDNFSAKKAFDWIEAKQEELKRLRDE